jgi:hypothetical protein
VRYKSVQSINEVVVDLWFCEYGVWQQEEKGHKMEFCFVD